MAKNENLVLFAKNPFHRDVIAGSSQNPYRYPAGVAISGHEYTLLLAPKGIESVENGGAGDDSSLHPALLDTDLSIHTGKQGLRGLPAPGSRSLLAGGQICRGGCTAFCTR